MFIVLKEKKHRYISRRLIIFCVVIINLVVFWNCIGYNISSSKCLVFCCFWTYIYFKRDSYIILWLSSPHFIRRIGREGKSSLAVTHLATLGVRRQRLAFRVKKCKFHNTKDEGAVIRGCFLCLEIWANDF